MAPDHDIEWAISRLRRFPYPIIETVTNCPICARDFQKGEELARLNCFHVFGWECIVESLREKPECPLCHTNAIQMAFSLDIDDCDSDEEEDERAAAHFRAQGEQDVWLVYNSINQETVDKLISGLPIRRFQHSMETGRHLCSCTICSIDFRAGGNIARLPCGHEVNADDCVALVYDCDYSANECIYMMNAQFDRQCIAKWLWMKPQCPYCRYDLVKKLSLDDF
uniref:RING-type E3 ubiquitin transferase n=1 Tax=Spongospora subterranea TaxID=70186 RepID=A0A0H5QHS2_9EUKA|eukprot:CRZ01585.1 hypothetical protein [Spongospora subterranea]